MADGKGDISGATLQTARLNTHTCMEKAVLKQSRKLLEARLAHVQGKAAAQTSLQYKNVLREWLAMSRMRVKELIYTRYIRLANTHILPYLGKLTLDHLKTQTVEKHIKDTSWQMWVDENESAKYWATILNGLKKRGVEDIFIACTDNLTGFSTAIEAVFPKTEIQNCIIHKIRNSTKYVSYKDLKALMADLKAVYTAVDESAALDTLDTFVEHWDKKYPKISASWWDNRPNLSTYFKFPQEIRRLIYTTNAIESFNRQLRKVTKAKSVFPTDDSQLKMLYLAMMDITKK